MLIFCLSVDGLNNAMLGTYGNAWIQTPALNRLASQSVVFDRFYAHSTDVQDVFYALLCKVYDTKNGTLITDDCDVFLHPRFAAFPNKHLLEVPQISEAVEELEETQMFRAAATSVDLWRKGGVKTNAFFWLHLQGLRGVWDFPLHYRELHRDREDPKPYSGTVPPETPTTSGVIEPDDLQAVMEAYSGGVAVLDDTLAGLMDVGEIDDAVFVLMGTSGFSLGEHNRIGINETLYGENLHLPLMIRFPQQKYAAMRVRQFVLPSDLGEFLSAGERFADTPLFQRISEENVTEIHSSLAFRNENGEAAILTPEWFLRQPSNGLPELYAKPDDRFEFNDVADRCPDVVQELIDRIAKNAAV